MRSRDVDILATGLLQTWEGMTSMNFIADVSVPPSEPLWRLPVDNSYTCHSFQCFPSEGLFGSGGLPGPFLEQIEVSIWGEALVRERNQQVISQHPHSQWKSWGYAPKVTVSQEVPARTESLLHSAVTCLSIPISLSLCFFFFFSLSHFPSPLLMKSFPNNAFSKIVVLGSAFGETQQRFSIKPSAWLSKGTHHQHLK